MNTIRKFKSAILLALLASVPLAWLAFSQSSKIDSPLDLDEYRDFMSHKVEDVEALADWYRDTRDWYAIITPPASDFILKQTAFPSVIPFDWRSFPKEMLDALADTLELEYGAPTYYLHIVENRDTRALEFRSRKGTILYTLAAPQGYFAFEHLATLYPRLYSGRFSPEVVAEYEAMYDPARVELAVRLIPSDPEYVEPYLYAKAKVREYELAAWIESQDDEGGMMMLMGGPDELRIASVSVQTNGILLELSFPEGFTNEVHIFKTQHLIEAVWELAVTGLHPDGTNNMTWLYTGTEDFAALTFADGVMDSDGDGWPDSHERFLYKTDPYDDESYPFVFQGDISYYGIETGTIYVLVIPEGDDNWSMARSVALQGPGPYTSRPVANNASYFVRAFRDVDGNGAYSTWEPAGEYPDVLHPYSDEPGISFSIEDVPSIWGTLDYGGTATGDIYVVAVSAPSWSKTYSAHIPWVQSYGSLTGDPVYVSFPVDYSIHGMPPGDYLIRAWIDENGDGEFDVTEEAGQYAVEPIPVSNRVTGINFALGLDTDEDGIPDWWEMEQYGGATNANASAALELAREEIVVRTLAIYGQYIAFTNAPGSSEDLADLRDALSNLSGIFYESEAEEP